MGGGSGQQPRRKRGQSGTDRFEVMFWRAVQLVGLAILLVEFTWHVFVLGVNPRLQVVGISFALMMGARGIEKLVGVWRSGG